MVKTRSVAYRLASATTTETSNRQLRFPFLEVSQKKIPIPNPREETVKGPIRLRLLQLPPAIKTEKTDC